MRTRAHPVAALATLAVGAAVAVGCGSDSADSSDSAELAEALPGDPQFVSYVDLEAAREELGLPDDADPADYDAFEGVEDQAPEALLVQAAAGSLLHVTEPFTRRFEADATANAIDHTQVSAAAASQAPDGRAAVLETNQPFDEIAGELEGAGFERDGEILSGEGVDPEVAYPYVADAGDGRIVVANELEQAEAALADEGEPGEAVGLLDELDSTQREAAVLPADVSCVTGLAVGGDPGGSELEIVLRVDGGADAELVADELPSVPGDEPVALGEAEVDGDLATVTASLEEGEADPSALVASGGIQGQLYDCG